MLEIDAVVGLPCAVGLPVSGFNVLRGSLNTRPLRILPHFFLSYPRFERRIRNMDERYLHGWTSKRPGSLKSDQVKEENVALVRQNDFSVNMFRCIAS